MTDTGATRGPLETPASTPNWAVDLLLLAITPAADLDALLRKRKIFDAAQTDDGNNLADMLRAALASDAARLARRHYEEHGMAQ